MKNIIFVRHAKSSWESFSIPDHDRPLNARGKRDATNMGKKLKELGIIPEIILSSSAKRAKKTAKKIASELNIENILIEEELYHAPPIIFMQIISKITEQYKNVMIVAHNPAMTDIINNFTNDSIFNVPTTGIFSVKFNVNNWQEVSFENGKLQDFIYPKMFLNEQ